jgi:hypothetical protein
VNPPLSPDSTSFPVHRPERSDNPPSRPLAESTALRLKGRQSQAKLSVNARSSTGAPPSSSSAAPASSASNTKSYDHDDTGDNTDRDDGNQLKNVGRYDEGYDKGRANREMKGETGELKEMQQDRQDRQERHEQQGRPGRQGRQGGLKRKGSCSCRGGGRPMLNPLYHSEPGNPLYNEEDTMDHGRPSTAAGDRGDRGEWGERNDRGDRGERGERSRRASSVSAREASAAAGQVGASGVAKISVVVRKRPLSRKESVRKDADVLEKTGTQNLRVYEPKQKVDLQRYVCRCSFLLLTLWWRSLCGWMWMWMGGRRENGV